MNQSINLGTICINHGDNQNEESQGRRNSRMRGTQERREEERWAEGDRWREGGRETMVAITSLSIYGYTFLYNVSFKLLPPTFPVSVMTSSSLSFFIEISTPIT